MMKRKLFCLFVAATAGLAGQVHAQPVSHRAIKIVVPFGSGALFMVASAQSELTNIKSVVDAAKADKLKGDSSPGSGSPMHILGEVFNSAAGVKIPQIPHRGMPDVIARMTILGGIAVGGDPSVLARSNIGDNTRHAKLIKGFGIQAN